MLKFLEKLFDAEVTIAPVVSVNDEEAKTYDTAEEAAKDMENNKSVSNIENNTTQQIREIAAKFD